MTTGRPQSGPSFCLSKRREELERKVCRIRKPPKVDAQLRSTEFRVDRSQNLTRCLLFRRLSWLRTSVWTSKTG